MGSYTKRKDAEAQELLRANLYTSKRKTYVPLGHTGAGFGKLASRAGWVMTGLHDSRAGSSWPRRESALGSSTRLTTVERGRGATCWARSAYSLFVSQNEVPKSEKLLLPFEDFIGSATASCCKTTVPLLLRALRTFQKALFTSRSIVTFMDFPEFELTLFFIRSFLFAKEREPKPLVARNMQGGGPEMPTAPPNSKKEELAHRMIMIFVNSSVTCSRTHFSALDFNITTSKIHGTIHKAQGR